MGSPTQEYGAPKCQMTFNNMFEIVIVWFVFGLHLYRGSVNKQH